MGNRDYLLSPSRKGAAVGLDEFPSIAASPQRRVHAPFLAELASAGLQRSACDSSGGRSRPFPETALPHLLSVGGRVARGVSLMVSK